MDNHKNLFAVDLSEHDEVVGVVYSIKNGQIHIEEVKGHNEIDLNPEDYKIIPIEKSSA